VRKLKSLQIPGLSVEEVLEEFNERVGEHGIVNESDVLSVSVMPNTTGLSINTGRTTGKAKVEVVIVFWSRG
jgi:hypothetical protein